MLSDMCKTKYFKFQNQGLIFTGTISNTSLTKIYKIIIIANCFRNLLGDAYNVLSQTIFYFLGYLKYTIDYDANISPGHRYNNLDIQEISPVMMLIIFEGQILLKNVIYLELSRERRATQCQITNQNMTTE